VKHVIITGSNGMIGKLVLENCLQNSSVATVTSITRKPIGIMHSKLTEVIHTDFLDYTSVEEHFKNKDVCFYCIGVYTGQVPVDEFKKITVDFTKAFSEVLKQNSPHASFCFLSGAGADSTEKSSTLFAKQKGIAENGLIRLQFRHTFIFRPGYIYPDTPRKEPNIGYQIFRILYKPLSAIYPNIGVTSKQLADKMVAIGLGGGDQVIYENKDIRK
jgi:nucleoside-diphosphate-sugar epimerase